MKSLLLPFVLALAGAAPAQDRVSVETFVTRFYQAAAVPDYDVLIASSDPTLIVRQNGALLTYADYKAITEAAKSAMAGKPLPKPGPTPRLSFERVDIVGERAIIDFTPEFPPERKGAKASSVKVHAILIWRDGAWRFWRVDVLPLNG